MEYLLGGAALLFLVLLVYDQWEESRDFGSSPLWDVPDIFPTKEG